MTAWTNDELENIGAADERQLASRREDGTLRKPVTIWVVSRSEDLHVRAFKGRPHPGFARFRRVAKDRSRRAACRKTSRLSTLTSRLAMRSMRSTGLEYGRYGARYVDPMVSAEARAATIKLIPQT